MSSNVHWLFFGFYKRGNFRNAQMVVGKICFSAFWGKNRKIYYFWSV